MPSQIDRGYSVSRPTQFPSRTTSVPQQQSQQQQQQQLHQRNDGQSFYSSPLSRAIEQTLTDSESWVEVSSNPSSSSVSSIGEEIDTTGLQVSSSSGMRRRRLHPQFHASQRREQRQQHVQRQVHTDSGSSPEVCEETESEEDHVLTSSTENFVSAQSSSHQTPLRQVFSARGVESDSSDDDDENATALGRRPPEPFRPQPNVFSHPPSHLTHRHSTSSITPHHGSRPSFSQRSQTRIDRRSHNFMSPDDQAENDAALRASLTTLLSCAAAARSRPKDGEKDLGERGNPVNYRQPVALRFAPESELMDPSPPPPPLSREATSQPLKSTSPESSSPPRESPDGEKTKRAATLASSSKSPRSSKKKKSSINEQALISPHLLTWVVSAGIVVIVSVAGWTGYVIGREVGRQETLNSLGVAGNMSAVADGGSCGREIIRSSGGTIKRFRWGGGMSRTVVA